jgi:hypothetical protein
MMEPLEQVTILMTLMRRLAQVMDHERAVLRGLRLDALSEIQEEKAALAEAYEIELGRLRRAPSALASLEPLVRDRLEEAMRSFQEALAANLNALLAAQAMVDRILRNMGESLARSTRAPGAPRQAGDGRGQIIPVAFNRTL